ncbi:O-antigen ligase family protein [Pseudoalteromonas rubra]|uniref:O-antigen ligase family protein n=1 Tax=Pseudoalteromonas rubra TaxID=43658 RepID=UPI000F798FCB|nr:O-antigen ligase family protein [Pseudoalteromonas rubra]
MLEKVKLNQFISALFIVLAVFSIYNRTFSLGFDIRFIVLPVLILGFFVAFIVKVKNDNYFLPLTALIAFLLLVIIIIQDQLAWLNSDLSKNNSVYKNVLILYCYNFLMVLYLFLNRDYLDNKVFLNSLIFSSLFLSFSSIYQVLVGDLPFVSAGSTGEAFQDELSILGVRPAGYAHDPNYTSLLMVFSIYVVSKTRPKNLFTIICLSLFAFTLFASGSKTVMMICFLLLIRIAFIKLKLRVLFNVGFIVVLLFGLLTVLSFFEQLSTFSQRLTMWNLAINGFYDSPFLGQGITGVRSLLAQDMRYVQPHNGWLALLVDHGLIVSSIIASCILALIFKAKTRGVRYLIVIFCFLSISNEMWVYPYWVLFLAFPFVFKINLGTKNV